MTSRRPQGESGWIPLTERRCRHLAAAPFDRMRGNGTMSRVDRGRGRRRELGAESGHCAEGGAGEWGQSDSRQVRVHCSIQDNKTLDLVFVCLLLWHADAIARDDIL